VRPAEDIKVLVVEDDPFFQRVLMKRLAGEGYQVFAASDGREGMKAIVSFEPDLVISDWMMPEVDGLELCQSVKTGLRESAPYFILLTAKGEVNNKLLALDTGADDYLVKPCDQGELMARVRAGLRIVLLTQELRATVETLHVTNAELTSARAEVERLSKEMLPICAFCRKVRDSDGAWHSLEDYIAQRTQADFTHGICPECRGEHYPVLAAEQRKPA
jgi:sigma-B regulation protein RsbU (phosphoserine phosphatase)